MSELTEFIKKYGKPYDSQNVLDMFAGGGTIPVEGFASIHEAAAHLGLR